MCKFMKVVKGLSSAVLLTLLLGSASAVYADEVQEYALDTMVVTATRTEKTVQDTPANVTVITQKELKDSGYQSVFQAVRELSQANCHTYQEDGGDYGGMMSRIRVRGIDDGTLVLVNGNPSNYMNHATLNTVPMDQIEKIEIVKGSNSVLYGPQAMGGVINIITRKATENGVSTKLAAATGSYGKERYNLTHRGNADGFY